jgi:hypothetical protein
MRMRHKDLYISSINMEREIIEQFLIKDIAQIVDYYIEPRLWRFLDKCYDLFPADTPDRDQYVECPCGESVQVKYYSYHKSSYGQHQLYHAFLYYADDNQRKTKEYNRIWYLNHPTHIADMLRENPEWMSENPTFHKKCIEIYKDRNICVRHIKTTDEHNYHVESLYTL